jgi:putative endonuclease
MKTVRQYYVYLLASQRNGTLYIGMTNDLQRRVYEHKMGIKKGFTFRYGVNKLVYFEIFNNVDEAILREKRLKKWNRAWKIKLIEEENKPWNDLAKDWYDDLLID